MSTVYLLRHAAARLAPGQRPGARFSLLNAELSDEGRAQAAAAAARLRAVPFDAAVASPALRAQETARIVAAPHDLTVASDDDLDEFPFGRPGDDEAAVLGAIAEAARAVADGTDPALPGGGTWHEHARRFARGFDRAAGRGSTVLVVAHGVANASFLAAACGVPLRDAFTWTTGHAAPVRVRHGDGAPRAALIDDAAPP